MVQWGIFLIVVVMKINRNKVVLPSAGVSCGESLEEQVRTGTECPGVHNVFGY